jgi:putative flippase GtrA
MIGLDLNFLRKHLRHLTEVLRFAIVGGIATVLHMAVAMATIVWFGLSPFIANACGFITGFMVSFAGQHYWTFRSDHHPVATIRQFGLVALTAFLASNIILAGLVRSGVVQPLVATLFAICFIPVVSFVLYKRYVFVARTRAS